MADQLDDIFPTDEAPIEAEPAPEVIEPVSEPEAEAVEPEPATPEVQTQAAPEERQPGFVPLAAMMDERDRRKAAEERANQLEQAQQAAAQAQTIPDAYDDPEGYLAFQQQHLQQALQQQKMQMSHHWAVEKYGNDGVEEARTWALEKAQKDPGFRAMLEAEMPMQVMPFDWIVQQHKRDGLVSQIGDRSMDDFVKDYIAKNPTLVGQIAPVAAIPMAVPQQASPPVKVPRSLATQGSGPSDIRQVATGPLAGVDAVFT